MCWTASCSALRRLLQLVCREFTTIYRGVDMHVGGTLTTLFFTGGNLTYERHPYNICLSKTTHVLSNWHQYEPNFTLTCLPASPENRRHANFKTLAWQWVSSFWVYLKLIQNYIELEKISYTKKLRNFHTISTVCRMHQSDKRSEN